MTKTNAFHYYVTMDRKHHFISILFITILSSVIYANTLNNGFVYDDNSTIVDNDFIKDPGNIPKLLNRDDYFGFSEEESYRPVVTFTYFMDHALFGLKPWGYHLINLMLHTTNGILVYIFLVYFFRFSTVISRQSAETFPLPLLISLLFVTHPLLTEAVNAVCFREDLLVFFFYMATMILYMKLRSTFSNGLLRSNSGLYLLSCMTYFLALLSKEMALTLPMIVFCYEWIYADKKNMRISEILLNRYNMGYVLVTLAYCYLRFYAFQNVHYVGYGTGNLNERLLLLPSILTGYLKLSLFPISLSIERTVHPVKSVLSPSFIASAVVITALLAGAFLIKRLGKEIFFGVLFFFITLTPVYNIIPITNSVAERYLYLPLLGFTVAAGITIHLTLHSFDLRHRLYFATIFVILFIYSMSVINRNKTWKDDYTLSYDAVQKMPNSFRAHIGLGITYSRKGQMSEALQQYRSALRLKPDYFLTHNLLGILYSDLGRLDLATEELKTSIKLKPDYMDSHNNLGLVYARQGRLDEAIKEYETALSLFPAYLEAHYNLGLAYQIKGMQEKAKDEFRTALKLNPGFLPARQELTR